MKRQCKKEDFSINFFSMPLFPVLIQVRGRVYSVESIPQMQTLLWKKARRKDIVYRFADANWTEWAYYLEKSIVAIMSAGQLSKEQLAVFCGFTAKSSSPEALKAYSKNLVYSFLVQAAKLPKGRKLPRR